MKRLVREEAQRRGKAARRLVDEGGVQEAPVVLSLELLLQQVWLVTFTAAPQAPVPGYSTVAKAATICAMTASVI